MAEERMRTVSAFNKSRDFDIDLREGRLKQAMKLISSLPAGEMLDIGCARGDWSAIWQARGWKCAGMEINRDMLASAQTRGIDARYCDLNQENFPFETERFDLVFAGEIIEHLVDTDGFLREIYRCLKPGGHVLLTTPNLASFENRMRLALGFYPRWVDFRLQGVGHVRAYTPRALKLQLTMLNLIPVKHLGNWVPFLPQSIIDDIKAPWLIGTGTLFPNLSMGIIILARKAG